MGCGQSQTDEELDCHYYQSNIFNILMIGAAGSGKTELIKQAISVSDYNEGEIYTSWMNSNYDDGPFVVNQYAPKELIKYVKNSISNINASTIENILHLLCFGYVRLMEKELKDVLIPNGVKQIIELYFAKPLVEAYITNLESVVYRFREISDEYIDHWSYYYDKISAVMFVIDLSCLDEICMDKNGENVNKMSYSFELFELFCVDVKQTHTPIWNKRDIFERKFRENPGLMSQCPEFENCKDEYGSEAICNIRHAFEKRMTDNNNLQIYPHVTCASDRNCIKRTWTDCQHIIINASLSGAGLM